MQNMIGNGDGGGGEMFIGVGDRRMRPHNHQQALKCPRCDSLNTKFCYYNNYNLSQPRHFCKSCRRYWTKGGILRSVPVGGGCRKTKRSKAKSSGGDAPRESKSNAQSSSSESSSLTTAAPAGATSTPPTNTTSSTSTVVFNPTNTTSSGSTVMFNLSDAMFDNGNPQAYSNLDHANHTSADGQIFATDIGSFTSLMTSSEEMIGFGTRNIPEQPVNQAAEGDNRSAVAVDELDMSNEGLAAALDWGSGGGGSDHGLFDLTAGVDQSYWNQSEWTDNDRSVNYLP